MDELPEVERRRSTEARPGVQPNIGLDRYFASVQAGMMDLSTRQANLEAEQKKLKDDVELLMTECNKRKAFWDAWKSKFFESALNKLGWFILALIGWGALQWISKLDIPGK